VGVPAASVEEVFETLSAAVGARALAYPDGEVDERRGWISTLDAETWPHVAGLMEIDSPLPEGHP
jgi:hypothetical protein